MLNNFSENQYFLGKLQKTVPGGGGLIGKVQRVITFGPPYMYPHHFSCIMNRDLMESKFCILISRFSRFARVFENFSRPGTRYDKREHSQKAG